MLYTWAGPEIAVATTKAYSTQMAVLHLLGLYFGDVLGTVDYETYSAMVRGLEALPGQMEPVLPRQREIRVEVAETADSHSIAHLPARKRQRRSRQDLRLDAELAERKRAVPDHVFGPSPLVERKTADHLGDLHDSTRFPAASSAPRR